MALQDEKLSKFIQAINKDAEERRARILAESEAFNKAELEKAETEALTDAYHLIQQEISKMRTGHPPGSVPKGTQAPPGPPC